MPKENSEKVRLNFVVSPRVASSLKELARKKGTSLTSTILSALIVYSKIIEEKDKGGKIILRGNDGKEHEVVFL